MQSRRLRAGPVGRACAVFSTCGPCFKPQPESCLLDFLVPIMAVNGMRGVA